MNVFDFMWSHRLEVAQLTMEHLVMVAISILIAAGIALPLGILMTRRPGLRRPILGIAHIVQTIASLAFIGFLIPFPLDVGLGMFIFRGVSMVDSRLILAGAIPTAALALLADFGLGAVEKRFSRLLCLVLIVAGLASCSRGDRIVVGSKNFTEQVILGEMLAQQIERKTHLPVDRKLNLGGTLVCHEAMTAGQIDTYVEYTGTGLTASLKEPPVNDSSLAYQKVKDGDKSKFGIEW